MKGNAPINPQRIVCGESAPPEVTPSEPKPYPNVWRQYPTMRTPPAVKPKAKNVKP